MAEVVSTARRTEYRKVFNLTVDGLHTYFVLAGSVSVLSHNCDPVKLYRAPHKGVDESNGLDPANFPQHGRHKGTAHLGEESVARQYAGQGDYQAGYHEFTMKPGFLVEFHPSVCSKVHDKDGGREWIIDQEDIELFDSYIDSARWIPWEKGDQFGF